LDEVVGFYRDGIGLTEIGGFRDHDGYEGVFLAVPGTGAHLELTAGGGHSAPAPDPESQLVLYLGDDEAVQTVLARLGVDPILPPTRIWPSMGSRSGIRTASGSFSCPSAGTASRRPDRDLDDVASPRTHGCRDRQRPVATAEPPLSWPHGRNTPAVPPAPNSSG